MGRKSRNLLTLAVVVMIIATVTLTGCTTPAPQAEKQQLYLLLWRIKRNRLLAQIIDDFEAKNPNIKWIYCCSQWILAQECKLGNATQWKRVHT